MKLLKRCKKDNKGFTLVEVIVVLVILAALAALATPVFVGQIERSRGQEALQFLQAVRAAMQRYWVQNNNSYVGASVLTPGCNLDFCPNDPNTVGAGQPRIFTYAFTAGPAAGTYTITATRAAIAGSGGQPAPAVPAGGGTISITEGGDCNGAGAYAGIC